MEELTKEEQVVLLLLRIGSEDNTSLLQSEELYKPFRGEFGDVMPERTVVYNGMPFKLENVPEIISELERKGYITPIAERNEKDLFHSKAVLYRLND